VPPNAFAPHRPGPFSAQFQGPYIPSSQTYRQGAPAPRYHTATEYYAPDRYGDPRTGWPAAAVPYHDDVPYGVPVPGDLTRLSHYGMRPPEPVAGVALADPSTAAGASVVKPFRAPPNHRSSLGPSQSVGLSKPPRASERRSDRASRRQQKTARAVEVATAVGTVAAGVLAVGAIGAMMAV